MRTFIFRRSKSAVVILSLVSLIGALSINMPVYASGARTWVISDDEDKISKDISTTEDTSEDNTTEIASDSVQESLAELTYRLVTEINQDELYEGSTGVEDDSAYHFSLDSIILGRLNANTDVSLLQFELFPGNPWGVYSSKIYAILRNTCFAGMFVYALALICKNLWSTNSRSFYLMKENLLTVLLMYALLYIMPVILRWVMVAREGITEAVYVNVFGSANLDFQSMFKAVTKTTSVHLTGLITWLAYSCAKFYYIGNYVYIAMISAILFALFPIVALCSVKNRRLLSDWLGTMITNILIPMVDFFLLMFPLVLRIMFQNAGGEDNAVYSLVEMVTIVLAITSLIPARNGIMRVFGNMLDLKTGINALSNTGRGIIQGAQAAMAAAQVFSGNGSGGNAKTAEEAASAAADASKEQNKGMAERIGSKGMPSLDALENNKGTGANNGPTVSNMADNLNPDHPGGTKDDSSTSSKSEGVNSVLKDNEKSTAPDETVNPNLVANAAAGGDVEVTDFNAGTGEPDIDLNNNPVEFTDNDDVGTGGVGEDNERTTKEEFDDLRAENLRDLDAARDTQTLISGELDSAKADSAVAQANMTSALDTRNTAAQDMKSFEAIIGKQNDLNRLNSQIANDQQLVEHYDAIGLSSSVGLNDEQQRAYSKAKEDIVKNNARVESLSAEIGREQDMVAMRHSNDGSVAPTDYESARQQWSNADKAYNDNAVAKREADSRVSENMKRLDEAKADVTQREQYEREFAHISKDRGYRGGGIVYADSQAYANDRAATDALKASLNEKHLLSFKNFESSAPSMGVLSEEERAAKYNSKHIYETSANATKMAAIMGGTFAGMSMSLAGGESHVDNGARAGATVGQMGGELAAKAMEDTMAGMEKPLDTTYIERFFDTSNKKENKK